MSSDTSSDIHDLDVLELNEAFLQQVAAHFRAKFADRMVGLPSPSCQGHQAQCDPF